MSKIITHLWFDGKVEEAAKFYKSVFKKCKIKSISKFPADAPGRKKGDTLLVELDINGSPFALLNGGPFFKLSEAVSFMIECKDQKEIDYYWNKLSSVPASEQCGWVKDKFGVSWQIVPKKLNQLLKSKDAKKRIKVFEAMMKMKKIIISDLEKAARG